MNSVSIGVIFIGLALAWVLQLALSLWQMRRFYARVAVMRKDGLTAIGMEGSAYRRRTYTVLTIDDDENIIHADALAGWTVFAQLRPVPNLLGHSLSEVLEGSPEDFDLSKKTFSSFQKAAMEFYKKEEGTDTDDTELREESSEERSVSELAELDEGGEN